MTTDSRVRWRDLSESYNFANAPDRERVLADFLVRELERIPAPRTVLDIGCGTGIGRDAGVLQDIRDHTERLWGVEPDDTVPQSPLLDRLEHATMEAADLPARSVDLSYSSLVMEHVEDPAGFFLAVHRVMRPGGRHYFVTINGRHYFGRATRLLHWLGVDEHVLRLVKSSEKVDAYHYPVRYRANTPEQITPAAEAAGFRDVEYVYLERKGPGGYMKGVFRPLYHLMRAKRRVWKDPRALMDLVVRMTA